MKDKLVMSRNFEEFCDSALVAEKFEKKHDKVVSVIEKINSDFEKYNIKFGALQDRPKCIKEVREKRGKQYMVYVMNQPFFSFLCMRFKGKKAIEWQLRFNDAFLELREVNARLVKRLNENKNNPELKELRKVGIGIRREETDAIKYFIEYAEKNGSKRFKWYYNDFTQMQNNALFIIDFKYDNIRSLLNVNQTSIIATCDKLIEDEIYKQVEQEIYYKDIFQNVKIKVLKFAEIVGRTQVIEKHKQMLLFED